MRDGSGETGRMRVERGDLSDLHFPLKAFLCTLERSWDDA